MHFKGQEWAGDTGAGETGVGGGDTGAGGAGGGAGNGDGGDGVVAGWYAVSECGVFNFTLNHPLITKLHMTLLLLPGALNCSAVRTVPRTFCISAKL